MPAQESTDQKVGGSSPSERADVFAGQSLIRRGSQEAESLSRGLTSHNFSQALSDLVNPGQRGLASLQVFLARVDVGLLRERRVVVAAHLLMMEIGTPACSMSVRVV